MLDFIIKKIEEESRKKVANSLKNTKKISESEMRKTRESIVDRWFGGFDSLSMKAATVYKSRYTTSGLKGNLVVESWVEVERYNDKPSAERWVSKYGGGKDPREYVLDLQLYEGIIGLPAKSEAYPEHNWENAHFHQRPIGLEAYTDRASDWDAYEDKIKSIIISELNK